MAGPINLTGGIQEAAYDVRHGNFARAPVDLVVGAVGARFPVAGPLLTTARNLLIGDPVLAEPDGDVDNVLVMDLEGSVQWAGRVPRSDPDAN